MEPHIAQGLKECEELRFSTDLDVVIFSNRMLCWYAYGGVFLYTGWAASQPYHMYTAPLKIFIFVFKCH